MSLAAHRNSNRKRDGSPIRRGDVVAAKLNETGTRLIAARGFANVSVEEILAEAGISRRTFYRHFRNKYELAATAINDALIDGTGMLETIGRQPASTWLPGIVDCYRELWSRHRQALAMIASLDPEVMKYIEKGHQQFGAALRNLLNKAQQKHLLRNDSATYTFTIISRTAVPLLKIYADHPDGDRLYSDAMLALLRK